MGKIKIKPPSEIVSTVSIAILLGILIGWKVLVNPGVVILAENFEVYSVESLCANYNPYWQEKFQYFDFGIADSVYLYGFFTGLAKFFGIPYAVLQRLLLLLPHVVAFLAMHRFVRYLLLSVKDTISGRLVYTVSLVSGFVYTFNPWIAVQPRDIALRWDYAFAPLILLLLFSIFEKRENRCRNIIFLCFFFSFTACFRYILIMLPVFILYLCIPGSRSGQGFSFRYTLRSIIIIVLLFSLLSLGKFLSPILYILESGHVPYAESFHEDMIGGASVIEVFTTKVMSSEGRRVLDETYTGTTHLIFLVISLFSFSYLVLIRRRLTRHEIFFLLLAVLALPLATLRNGPCAEVTRWLLTEAPYSDLYGRLLRHADWNSLPIVLAFAVMCGFAVREVLYRLPASAIGRYCASFLYLAIVGICVLSSWPLVTGDMNGYWRPSHVPDEFEIVNESFRKDNDDYHVIWVPSYWENRAKWAENSGPHDHSAPTCNFAIRSSAKPSYLTERFYFFDYYSVLGRRPGLRPLDGYAGGNMAGIYRDVNIRFVVIHNDVNWTEPSPPAGLNSARVSSAASRLMNSGKIDSFSEIGFIQKVRMSDESSEVRATIPVCILGGLSAHGAIHDAGVMTENVSLVYLEDRIMQWRDFQSLLRASPALIVKGRTGIKETLTASATDTDNLIAPYEHTKKNNPLEGWSRCSVQNDITHPYFQEALAALDLKSWSWDFDFGRGLVYTTLTDAEMEMTVRIPLEGTYILYLRYFAGQQGGAFTLSVDGIAFPILSKSNRNHFTSEILTYMNLSGGESNIKLKNLYGFNVVNLIGIIPAYEYEKREKAIEDITKSKSFIYIYEAETDCEAAEAVIHRDENASNGYSLRFDQPGTVRTTVDITQRCAYTLYLRMKGECSVSAADSPSMDIKADDLEFIRMPLDTLFPGEYEIEITPVEFPSLIDVLWLIPADYGSNLSDIFLFEGDCPEVKVSRREQSRIALTTKAVRPFLITVSDAYDPLIIARTDERKQKPIRVFGLINGFLMEEAGDAHVDIEFVPQTWARAGIRISVTTAILMIALLLAVWIKNCITERRKRSRT